MDRDDVVGIFDENGLLSNFVENFEFREDQMNMALDVLSAYQRPSVVAIEAGTGIGKSFSYLVPALEFAFADSEDRTVIATSTINLQKQLLEKDLPVLFEMFGKRCNVAIAVGRSNYICLRRLEEEVRATALFAEDEQSELGKLRAFAHESSTGLRSDYSGRPDAAVWASICSDSDFCQGGKCPFFSKCFYFKSKRTLSDASIIICNHHLLFVDSNSRYESSLDYSEDCILPPFSRLVIDEAHNIERHATDLFTSEFSAWILSRQMNFIHGYRSTGGGRTVKLLDELLPYCSDKELYEKILDFFTVVISNADTVNMALVNRLEYAKITRILLTRSNASKVLSDIESVATMLLDNIRRLTGLLSSFALKVMTDEQMKGRVDELNVHIRRITDIAAVLESFMNVAKWTEDVHFLEIEKRGNVKFVVFKIAPLEVSGILNNALFSKIDSVVCTSATLDLNDGFSYWSTSIGLPVTEKPFIRKTYRSPFDYKNRLMLLTPYDAPDFNKDNQQEYADYLCTQIYSAVSSSGGGSLILFTSIKLMDYVYSNLCPSLSALDLTCMKQGDMDRFALLEKFKEDTDSVLFATDSFWEGVDAPGNTLRLVIITKLPFRMPDEPIYRARYSKLETEGRSGFYCLSLPDATMRLKQGFGRLMRHTTDKGIVLILDSRIVKKSYGAIMLNSLPESYYPETSVNSVATKIESFLF